MTTATAGLVIEFASLFFAATLAGEEFIVRYSIHPAFAALEDSAQIRARQGLIKTTRVLVPIMLFLAVVSGALLLVAGRDEPGGVLRWAGAIGLFVFILTFMGTVPLDRRVASWSPDAPPAEWKVTIRRWARLDTLRSSVAMLAFLCFLVAGILRFTLG